MANVEKDRTVVSLSFEYLPTHHFAERHETVIAATPAAILDAVARIEPNDDPFIGRLIALRQLPHRVFGKPSSTTGAFGLKDFTLLGRSDRGIAYGLVGRFWRLDFGLEPIADGQSFQAFDKPGIAKLVMSFEVQPLPTGRMSLATMTRIFCPDRATRLRLRPYWAAIRPASGFIRRRMLRLVKEQAEREDRRLAG